MTVATEKLRSYKSLWNAGYFNKHRLPGKILSNILRSKNKKSHSCNCNIYTQLPNRYNCKDRYVVYKYTCNICNAFYVGKKPPIFTRHAEHTNDIRKANMNNALFEHLRTYHNTTSYTIDNFSITFINKYSNTLETTISEAEHIHNLHPSINRKRELPEYTLTKHHTNRTVFNANI